MNKFLLSLCFLALVGAISCTSSSDRLKSEEEFIQDTLPETTIDSIPKVMEMPVTTGDNSMNSVDWAGRYFATLPCASCEGIETWVTLNLDGTFVLKTHHMGLNDDREEIFTGKFTWDETGSMVTLQGLIGDAPGKYKVGENRIWHLDRDGNVIEGDLAERYILVKQY